jgi:hypothetical protein
MHLTYNEVTLAYHKYVQLQAFFSSLLDTWRKTSGREIDPAILRFISPMGFGHINFNGVIVFPFEHYRAQLLAAARGFRARSARR